MAANGREQKTNLLEPRDALAETEDAQHDIHERVDVVADTRIDDMVVIDCPDIRQPVQADDESRQQEEAEHIERQEIGPVREQHERHSRHDTGSHQEQCEIWRRQREVALRRRHEHADVRHGKRHHQQRLERDAREWVEVQLFLECAVDRERHGQHDSHPGQFAELVRHEHNANGRQWPRAED